MSSLILIPLSSLFSFMSTAGGVSAATCPSAPRAPKGTQGHPQRHRLCEVPASGTAGLGQAVTPSFLGSLAVMLMGRDGEDGPQAAPVDDVGEDRDAHRARPLPSQGGNVVVTGGPSPFALSPAMMLRAPWVPPPHPSFWMFLVKGDAWVPLCSRGMRHRTACPGLSPVPPQGHLGDGWSAVVCRGCSQMPGTK